jgi:redox-sensitive bicupin YhaK (pirin superfamily)
MGETREIAEVIESRETLEGAGVRLRRVFGFGEVPRFDPFLLLDHFGSDDPADYLAGFPWHPHRGIETISYMLEGEMEHGDSLGNQGTIGTGDVQWMTAGSGIVHQEMPKRGESGRMYGFQLWANLPAAEKMMAPRYRDVPAATIPTLELDGGVRIKVIAGRVGDVRGPVGDVVIEPEYLDVSLPAGERYRHPTRRGHTVLAFVFEGSVALDAAQGPIPSGRLARFGDGEEIAASAGAESARFLLVSGQPIGEPIAWRGPIVMNTEEELRTAFAEYHDGTFIR